MPTPQRQLRLHFVHHTVATGSAPDGGDAVFILVGDDPQQHAVLLGCPHTCDRLIEHLREARACVWPHRSGGADESYEFDSGLAAPGAEVTYLAGQAQGSEPLPVEAVERAVARHERAARMLRKSLDAAGRAGSESTMTAKPRLGMVPIKIGETVVYVADKPFRSASGRYEWVACPSA